MMNEEIRIKYDPQGLVPAIVQDIDSGQVLMLAYMNEEALQATLRTRQAHFWSRSRAELWHKGATSGNYLHVVALSIDCDGDTLLLRVHPDGPACHTGNITCFYRQLSK
jgi:phosphoribosyl-AMP cyclohydrolase / phosphoribosyl-ATP pyrophosphohydrolase